jgi:tetratricopeptide (TPR) repeat protein
VNLQHFILDGAIWKLRDGAVARVLLADPGPALGPLGPEPDRTPWRRRAVWAAAATGTALALGAAWEYEIGWVAATEREDHARAGAAEQRLILIGRDNPLFYDRRARLASQRGDLAAAIGEYRRSLALYPTPEAWYALGVLQVRTGDAAGAQRALERSLELAHTPEAWTALGTVHELRGEDERAAGAYLRALELDGAYVPGLHLSGLYWLGRGQAGLARPLLERAVALAPDDEVLRADLRRAGG